MAKAAGSAGAKKSATKAPTKNEIFNSIAESTGLSKKQVAGVFESLEKEVRKHMSSKGAGVFALPGLLKITKQKVPAKPARYNVPDPFNKGQFRDYPAKPASVKIKVRALKNLKDMA